MSKVLVISPEAVPVAGRLAAGPGIRYWQIAKSLAKDYKHNVTLAVPQKDFKATDKGPIPMVPWDLKNICDLADDHDCVVMPHVHSGLSTAYRKNANPKIPTAVDLYDPVLIENIGLQPVNEEGARSFSHYLSGVIPILKRGDYFVCANERQRLYYIGVLNALGRINPLTYREGILEIVPFGVDEKPAEKTKGVMRGQTVDPEDKVILWFSGIYPWFDALTLIEAMPAVLKEEPRAKLVILGGAHPAGHAPDDEYLRTQARSKELGLFGKTVLFMEWQPYEDRADWYLESDIAVVTHKPSLETELSHRTRVIDFLWGGLPVITSRGDAVGQMIESRGCGQTVAAGDKEALAESIVALLSDDLKRKKMAALARELAATELTWKKVIEPLADFCANPQIAADRKDERLAQETLTAIDTIDEHFRLTPIVNHTKTLWQKVQDVYEAEGLSGTINRSVDVVARQFKKGESGEDKR